MEQDTAMSATHRVRSTRAVQYKPPAGAAAQREAQHALHFLFHPASVSPI